MTRVYVDSGVLIAAATLRDPVLAQRALDYLSNPYLSWLSSVCVWLETVPKATHHGRQVELHFYETFFAKALSLETWDSTLLLSARRNGLRFGLSAVDALHIAAAAALGADEIVTTERASSPLHRVTDPCIVSIAVTRAGRS